LISTSAAESSISSTRSGGIVGKSMAGLSARPG
jgi:hypothetical protein